MQTESATRQTGKSTSESTEPRRPGRPRSTKSEEAIIKATSTLLAEAGYTGLTLGKVAARARASKSTIYRRWPSKEHLIVAAFERWPTLVPHDRGDVLEELMDLYRQFLRVLHRPPVSGVMPTLLAERAHNPELATVLDPLMEKRRMPAHNPRVA